MGKIEQQMARDHRARVEKLARIAELEAALSQEREAREKAEKDAEQARVELGEAMLVIEQQDRDLETVQGKLEAVWNKSARLEASLAEAKRLSEDLIASLDPDTLNPEQFNAWSALSGFLAQEPNHGR